MASMNTKYFTQQNFSYDVLQSSLPVLVHVYATWSGPCKQMTPIVDALADEYAGRAKVGTLPFDDSPDIVRYYGVTSPPTFMVFKGGSRVAQRVGTATREQLIQLLAL